MGSEAFIGEIILFAGDFAPAGWLFCDGASYQKSQFEALCSILNYRFGGDGHSVFKVPDLRGRVPVGVGSGVTPSPRNLGDSGGEEYVTLRHNMMPAHNHIGTTELVGSVKAKLVGVSDPGMQDMPQGNFIASKAGSFLRAGSRAELNPGSVEIDTHDLSVKVFVSNSGLGQPHENMPPFTVLNYIIAYLGDYPPRT